MYPNSYFNLFPAFPRDDTCFVIMSFASEFEDRWVNVIQPAVATVSVSGVRQQAYRVDAGVIGDSILTEILTRIGNARLVLADVTTIGTLDDRPVRNGNVMYELGLAHAVRLPEEVILFRSDSDQLLFDVANVRVNPYQPDENPAVARQIVFKALSDAIREIEMKRHLAVDRAAQGLDFHSFAALTDAAGPSGLQPRPMQNLAQQFSNAAHNALIPRLLEIGAIEMNYPTLTPQLLEANTGNSVESLFRYQLTPFGREIVTHAGEQMGLKDPQMRQRFAEFEASRKDAT